MCVCVCLFIDGLYLPSPLPSPALPLKCQGSGSSSSGVRRKRRNHRHRSERQASSELQNGEVSTSTSGQFTHLLKLVPTSWLNTHIDHCLCCRWRSVCWGCVQREWSVSIWWTPQLADSCDALPTWVSPHRLHTQRQLHWGPAGEIWCHFFAIKPQRWCHSSDGEVTVCRHITTPFYHLRVQTAY